MPALQSPTTLAGVDPITRNPADGTLDVAPGVVGLRSLIVNVYFVDAPPAAVVNGGRSKRCWVLVDAGLPVSGPAIRATAERLYGKDGRPQCILLTHAHFDHVGALEALAREWNVPVYAHALELPYLTGKASYPPPDPWAGSGVMPLTAPLYPRGPIDVRGVQPLPLNGVVPHLPEWKWVHTPGHTPGHVSFFRERDRVLLAGDAFVTTKQSSLTHVLAQAQAVYGPPNYFTHDWQEAGRSVRELAALRPSVAACGHGTPMRGPRLTAQLDDLARNFRRRAVPSGGRYADDPVRFDENGPRYVPPSKGVPPRVWVKAGALAAAAVAGLVIYKRATRREATLAEKAAHAAREAAERVYETAKDAKRSWWG